MGRVYWITAACILSSLLGSIVQFDPFCPQELNSAFYTWEYVPTPGGLIMFKAEITMMTSVRCFGLELDGPFTTRVQTYADNHDCDHT